MFPSFFKLEKNSRFDGIDNGHGSAHSFPFMTAIFLLTWQGFYAYESKTNLKLMDDTGINIPIIGLNKL